MKKILLASLLLGLTAAPAIADSGPDGDESGSVTCTASPSISFVQAGNVVGVQFKGCGTASVVGKRLESGAVVWRYSQSISGSANFGQDFSMLSEAFGGGRSTVRVTATIGSLSRTQDFKF